jgi:hypothetical protein
MRALRSTLGPDGAGVGVGLGAGVAPGVGAGEGVAATGGVDVGALGSAPLLPQAPSAIDRAVRIRPRMLLPSKPSSPLGTPRPAP